MPNTVRADDGLTKKIENRRGPTKLYTYNNDERSSKSETYIRKGGYDTVLYYTNTYTVLYYTILTQPLEKCEIVLAPAFEWVFTAS